MESEELCAQCRDSLSVVEDKEKCPRCNSESIEYSYGLAGGGHGTYSYCLACSTVFDKIQDEE